MEKTKFPMNECNREIPIYCHANIFGIHAILDRIWLIETATKNSLTLQWKWTMPTFSSLFLVFTDDSDLSRRSHDRSCISIQFIVSIFSSHKPNYCQQWCDQLNPSLCPPCRATGKSVKSSKYSLNRNWPQMWRKQAETLEQPISCESE